MIGAVTRTGSGLGWASLRSLQLALNPDHAGMVVVPVGQRRCDDGITEDVAPFGEVPVRGHDHRALPVPVASMACSAGFEPVHDCVDAGIEVTTQLLAAEADYGPALGLDGKVA